jgi:hypothetical protein
MLCKAESRDPEHCLKEGRKVTRCAQDLYVPLLLSLRGWRLIGWCGIGLRRCGLRVWKSLMHIGSAWRGTTRSVPASLLSPSRGCAEDSADV